MSDPITYGFGTADFSKQPANEYVQRGAEWLNAQGWTIHNPVQLVRDLLRESGALSRIEEQGRLIEELHRTPGHVDLAKVNASLRGENGRLRKEVERRGEVFDNDIRSIRHFQDEAEKAEQRIEELEAERPNDEATSQLLQTIEALRDATDDEWKAHMLDGTAYILKTYADSHREMKMRLRDMEAKVEELEKALRQIIAEADKTHGDGYPHEASDADTYEDIARAALSQARQSDE